jgi:hypothetical protein
MDVWNEVGRATVEAKMKWKSGMGFLRSVSLHSLQVEKSFVLRNQCHSDPHCLQADFRHSLHQPKRSSLYTLVTFQMDDYILPLMGAIIIIVATYYYFVVLNKPKKLASIPAPMVKKGTAAAAKRKPAKKKEEVCFKA